MASPNPWRRRALSLLLILGVWFLVHWWQTRPLASGPAPPLAGTLVSGGPVDLAQWRGQPVLVHFWAEWCPLCRAEQASIQAISRDLPVLSVALQSGDPAQVRAHLAGAGLDFPTLADPYGEIATAWGVQVVPTSFVIDGAGIIRFTEVGYATEIGLRARLWAASALARPSAGMP